MDFDGSLDLPQKLLRRLDWVIASYHGPICMPGTLEQNTQGWMRIAENPDVDVIGHCGDGRYVFDLEKAIKQFKAYDKIVEINAHSFTGAPRAHYNCRRLPAAAPNIRCRWWSAPTPIFVWMLATWPLR